MLVSDAPVSVQYIYAGFVFYDASSGIASQPSQLCVPVQMSVLIND